MKFLAAVSLTILLCGCSNMDIAVGVAIDAVGRESIHAACEKHGIPGCYAVRAFTINGREEHPRPDRPVMVRGKLNPTREPKRGITLSPADVREFLAAATTHDHSAWQAACFYPHHGLVFYDANNKPIGHYTVCFICQTNDFDTGKFSGAPDWNRLRKMFGTLGLPPLSVKH